MITGLAAILLISEDAPALADFYRSVLQLPLQDEVHDGVPLHYGCDLQGVHLAIHPAESWPGIASREPRSPVVVLATADVNDAYERIVGAGVTVTPPYDHGFGILISLRDPDGNNVQLLESKTG